MAQKLTPFQPYNPAADEELLKQAFDADWYLQTYADVAAAGIDPFLHFLRYGEAEGRDPSPTFNIRPYREIYMEGEPPEASALRHYLERGRDLGYEPNLGGALSYPRMVGRQEQSDILELSELIRHARSMIRKPLFVVYLAAAEPPLIARVRVMLEAQIYDRWTVCVGSAAVQAEVEALDPEDWALVWLEGDEALHAAAFYCYASRMNERPAADIIYADEDQIDGSGRRRRPFFKPDWSPDYLESFDYIATGAAVGGHVALPALTQARNSYDFLLRASENAIHVEHVRQVLIHRSSGLDASRPAAGIADDIKALEGRLARTGRTGVVTPIGADRGCYDMKLTLAALPLVSVVIPTAGKIVDIGGRQVDLLFNCLDKLDAVSTYPNLEIVVVHNDDLGEERLAALVARGVKALAYRQEFNVARKLNMGAAQSSGEILLLLNDDVEPLTPNWIQLMVQHFEKPNVAIVGPKLLFPEMKIQHAGVVMVNAKPDHLRFMYPRGDEGYFYSTRATRDFTAVTGAVMMIRASAYREIGGYAENLPINFNDVDFCLRIREKNHTIVYTPQAELIHYESMSRVRKVDSFEIETIEDRWAAFTTDPYYNEAMLRRTRPDYTVVSSRSHIG